MDSTRLRSTDGFVLNVLETVQKTRRDALMIDAVQLDGAVFNSITSTKQANENARRA